MTIPAVTHPFVASPNPRYTHCARCGLAEVHPIHASPRTDVETPNTTTTDGGW